MSYEKYYQGGWKSGETGGTPITPEALNHMEEGIEESNKNLLPNPQTADNATFLRNDNTWQKVTPANIGAAASSHNHAAGNITSGTLSADRLPTVPITKGGLGGTDRLTSAKNLTNEAVSSPGYVVSLTGGWKNFGYTTLQQLRNASGLGNTTGALPIANGGTGSTGTSTSSANNSHFYAHFAKFGNLVVCTLLPKASTDTMIYESTLTIPSGYRPRKTWDFLIYSYKNKNNGGDGTVYVQAYQGGSLKASDAYGLTIGEACNTYSWIAG